MEQGFEAKIKLILSDTFEDLSCQTFHTEAG